MKIKYARATVALVLMAALAACGGKAEFNVSGTITGLSNPGMVLANGSDTLAVPAFSTTFTMPHQIPYGTPYSVVVQTQPAHMTCSPLTPTADSAGHTTNIAIVFQCAQNAYPLGGSINGLTGDGLVLINGSQSTPLTVASNATSFQFTEQVADGSPYGVSVFANPTGQVCTVDKNPTGIMGDSAISNVVVNCVAAPAAS
ncbi:hypothetical protein [Rugamonas sp.]|uniref:hypothetical protein n=1 Tax=Rugamonas sp. TaxID=1926287 RepID=UPI0025E3787B|nr:hypothetical protein [Rugamonas sp.]